MHFPLDCECGKTVFATEGMAASRIRCECGRYVQVPSLDEIKRRKLGSGAEALAPSTRIEEPLRQPGPIVVYILVMAVFGLALMPFIVLSFSRSGLPAAIGAVLLCGGHLWLFTVIFAGSPKAALITLLPLIGPFLVVRFIIEHFRLARGPLFCQLLGYALWVGSVLNSGTVGWRQ